MKRSKGKKIGALLMSVLMLGSVVNIVLTVEAEETISGSYVNFEDITSSSDLIGLGFNNRNNTFVNNTTVDTVGNTQALTKLADQIAYEPAVMKDNDLRPGKVEFRFKTAKTPEGKNFSQMIQFYPVVFGPCKDAGGNDVYWYNGGNSGYQNSARPYFAFSLTTYKTSSYQLTQSNGGNWFDVGKEDAEIWTMTKTQTWPSTMSACEWGTFICDYDWSNFDAAHSYVLGLTFHILIGEIEYKQAFTLTLAKTGDEQIVSLMENFTKGGIGLKLGNDANWTAAYDNLAVTWVDANGTEYKPNYLPEAMALGATLATTEGEDGTIKTQMGFGFTEAREALEKNGAIVKDYGAVFVAGTKDYATMKENAEHVLKQGAVTGYVKTKIADSSLPDEYRVTITNSDGQNIGKRVTAIGYVRTTDGAIYYTGEYTSDSIVQANLNNYSVMSVLKNIFNKTYLSDPDQSRLQAALAAYNEQQGKVYDMAYIQNAVQEGTTDTEQRNLLKALHFGLYNN